MFSHLMTELLLLSSKIELKPDKQEQEVSPWSLVVLLLNKGQIISLLETL